VSEKKRTIMEIVYTYPDYRATAQYADQPVGFRLDLTNGDSVERKAKGDVITLRANELEQRKIDEVVEIPLGWRSRMVRTKDEEIKAQKK